MHDTKPIRSRVYRQIIAVLEDDLKGGELLMKEVWEACATEDQAAAARHALGEIIEGLRSREAIAWTGPSRAEMTSKLVESFSTYARDLLLDELVECTVRYNLGPLDGEECRIATAILERLATLGIARKEHRGGCEIWEGSRLCRCPWIVPS